MTDTRREAIDRIATGLKTLNASIRDMYPYQRYAILDLYADALLALLARAEAAEEFKAHWERTKIPEEMRGASRYWEARWRDEAARVKALEEALTRAERKLSAYVGVCKGDKELTDTVLPMVRAALDSAGALTWAARVERDDLRAFKDHLKKTRVPAVPKTAIYAACAFVMIAGSAPFLHLIFFVVRQWWMS